MLFLYPLQPSWTRLRASLAKAFSRLCFLGLVTACAFAADAGNPSAPLSTPPPQSLYINVQLSKPVKMNSLRPGDSIEGSLSQDVYAGDRKLFPAGDHVRLTVGNVERRKRQPNDHWPWIVRVFSPRHENYPLFRSADIALPDGRTVPLQVSL